MPILTVQQTRRNTNLSKTFNVFSVIALVLTIVGALNWLLVGIFQFNFVNWITMGLSWLESVIYIVVGIAGIFMLVWLCTARCKMVHDDWDNKYTRERTVH